MKLVGKIFKWLWISFSSVITVLWFMLLCSVMIKKIRARKDYDASGFEDLLNYLKTTRERDFRTSAKKLERVGF